MTTTLLNLVTDYGATPSEPDTAVVHFNTDATTIYANNNVVLTIPANVSKYVFDRSPVDSFRWQAGIKNLTVLGYGATLGDDGILADSPAFQFGGLGPVNNVANSARINSVAAGATQATCMTVADATKFVAGTYVIVCGMALQIGGFPPNWYYWDYVKVLSADGTSGIVTFDRPLTNYYDSNWPITNWNGTFAADGGPAGIFNVAGFDTTLLNQGLTLDSLRGPNAVGNDVTFQDCTFSNAPFTVSINDKLHLSNVLAQGLKFEVDKCITHMVVDNGCNIQQLWHQNAGTKLLNVQNSTITWLNGTPQNTVLEDSSIGRLTIGAFYGQTKTVSAYNLTDLATIEASGSTDTGGDGAPGVNVAYTMSGGVITIPNSTRATLGVAPFTVPGSFCFWTGKYRNQGTFRVIGIDKDSTNIYVQTDQTGGFPPGPLTSGGQLNIEAHPCPNFTMQNCTGGIDATDFSGAPAARPIYSYTKRYYNGLTCRPSPNEPPRPTSWGRIVSMKINVTSAYVGALSCVVIDQPTLKSDYSEFRWKPQVNLGIAGERVIVPPSISNPTGVTGAQSLDANLGVPEAVWLAGFPFFGPNISADKSGEGAGAFAFSVEVITDQGINTNYIHPTFALRTRLHV